MQKSKLTPDPIRDAPDGHGNGQSPGPVSVIPGRATRDLRFAQYPMTFFVLSYCCSHAKGYTATFWVNQRTIAKDVNISQQAISQHFRKLVQWGYIEKLRKEDNRKPYGKQGALWRIIFDPTMSHKDATAWANRQHLQEEEEQQAVNETIKLVQKGAKGQQQKNKIQPILPVDKSVDNFKDTSPSLSDKDSSDKVQLVQVDKVQLVSKHLSRTIDKEISKNDCRRLCSQYSQLVHKRWGRGFRHDLRQEHLAEELLKMGYEVDTFIQDADKLLEYLFKKSKQPPHSLQYFIARKNNQAKPMEPMDMLKQTLSRKKLNA